MLMSKNDPRKSVENIFQLPDVRRAIPVPALQIARAQPNPPILFEQWVAVRDRAAAALLGGTKLLLLTGAPGTGKTVLVEHVARVLRAAGRTVIIQLADADPAPPDSGMTLCVDEADRLSTSKLRQLLDEAAGTVILTGLAPLARRVATGTVHLTLEPLAQKEARDYIAKWLALNGRTPAELDDAAVTTLIESSGGVPRLLSTLLAASSWLAKIGDSPIIEAVHVYEAAESRSVLARPAAPETGAALTTPMRRSRVMWAAPLTAMVLATAGAAIVPRLLPAQTDHALARAANLVHEAKDWLRAEPLEPPPRPAQSALPKLGLR